LLIVRIAKAGEVRGIFIDAVSRMEAAGTSTLNPHVPAVMHLT
jgi:hypothetical protein